MDLPKQHIKLVSFDQEPSLRFLSRLSLALHLVLLLTESKGFLNEDS